MEGNFVSPVEFDWDDSALIKIYNESMMKVKDKIQNYNMANGASATKNSKKKSCSKAIEESGSKVKKWAVGDFCQAVYSEDGELYEAEILCIDDFDDDKYLVKFDSYENEEIVYGSDIHPSKGVLARQEQWKAATQDWGIYNYCSAPCSADGKFYEARIVGFPSEKNCSVRFIGYDNFEIVPLNRLRPSGGEMARSLQEEFVKELKPANEVLDDELSSLSSHYSSVSGASNARMVHEPIHQSPIDNRRPLSQTESNEFIPSVTSHEGSVRRHRSSSRPLYTTHPMSPPSMMPVSPAADEDEGLSSMLMSWYMAGYNTGFYQSRNSNARCSCRNCPRRARN